MADPIITVEKLSKRYIIGHQRDKEDGLRHVLERAIRSPAQFLRLMRKRRSATREEFWALRDVNLEVTQGEVVGIIGRNGAGKSTLLKILSRITEPTHGRITLDGRVASLLEVGTGFHPELTARENIYLNGAILGMSRLEIKSKFDEIVAFAEIEKFLDTPVKRFSSGMYVRLAFAVAGHLEPEILIVDEVLAVGDASFQKKCLGRMSLAAQSGRTVLFVSHNMPTVANLCRRCVMLRSGSIVADGRTADVIGTYLSEFSGSTAVPLAHRTDRVGSGEVAATSLELLDAEGNRLEHAMSGQDIMLRIGLRFASTHRPRDCRATLVVNRDEQLYIVLSSAMVNHQSLDLTDATHIDFVIPALPLGSGVYTIDCTLESAQLCDTVRQATELSVVDGDYFGTGRNRPSTYWKNVGTLVRHSCLVGSPENSIPKVPR